MSEAVTGWKPRSGRANWRAPVKCDCGKIQYRDEAAALAAADRRRADFDTPFRAYKCPGTRRWHLATRGFRPAALKSRARIMAWHISARRVIGWDALLREIGIEPCLPPSRQQKTARQILRAFADLSLVEMDDRHPPYISATDADGLFRVMAVGLEEYVKSRTRDRRIETTGG